MEASHYSIGTHTFIVLNESNIQTCFFSKFFSIKALKEITTSITKYFRFNNKNPFYSSFNNFHNSNV